MSEADLMQVARGAESGRRAAWAQFYAMRELHEGDADAIGRSVGSLTSHQESGCFCEPMALGFGVCCSYGGHFLASWFLRIVLGHTSMWEDFRYLLQISEDIPRCEKHEARHKPTEVDLRAESNALRLRLQRLNPQTDPTYDRLFHRLVAVDTELRRLREKRPSPTPQDESA